METFIIREPITVFGVQVKTFPAGIPETFNTLAQNLPNGYARPYYGISWMSGDKVIYYALAAELNPGEADQTGYEKLVIEKGTYATVSVKGWRKNTSVIGEVFHDMMEQPGMDKKQPCVEWYKSDEEMLCLIKTGSL